MNFEQYILCFFIYAFLGYLCEVVYCSICQRKLVNRGYLYSPICPIYGVGAVVVVFFMSPLIKHWYLVLIVGIILTSTLEYLTSLIMEIIFHMRWWDYSKRKFNINGRVCIRNSLMFGALVMVVMYALQPLVIKMFSYFSPLGIRIADAILLLILVVDMIFSTIKNINISKVIVKITKMSYEAKEKILELKDEAKEKIYNARTNASEKIIEAKDTLYKSIVERLNELVKKYPNIAYRNFGKGNKKITVKEFVNNQEKNKDDNNGGDC